jgi:hypothetical protein
MPLAIEGVAPVSKACVSIKLKNLSRFLVKQTKVHNPFMM